MENKEFCDNRDISGFPIVRFYTKEGTYEYDGNRKVDDMI